MDKERGNNSQPEPQANKPRTLEAVMLEREYQAKAMPMKVIGYMDMLGFGALVRAHPRSLNVEISDDGDRVGVENSKSAVRFGRFHSVLDRMAMEFADATHPERMMIFSDCAFAIYDNALQAAVSLCRVMRRFLSLAIPVRMCIAKGTCHSERFSIESFNSFNLTRSMFYGSGIVFAVSGEENSGPGCRIFLHKSFELPDRTLIEGRLQIMPMPQPSEHAEYELNYLYEPVPATEGDPEKKDLDLFGGLTLLRSELREPIQPQVLTQYDESFAAFNRMRERYGRYQIAAPQFDGQGNPLEPQR